MTKYAFIAIHLDQSSIRNPGTGHLLFDGDNGNGPISRPNCKDAGNHGWDFVLE